MKIQLDTAARQFLKGLAQTIKPVTLIGNKGLTDAVIRETAIHLEAHELIKVQVQNDEREEREAIFDQLCDALDAAPVQHIGKQLVLWRPSDKQKITLPSTKRKKS